MLATRLRKITAEVEEVGERERQRQCDSVFGEGSKGSGSNDRLAVCSTNSRVRRMPSAAGETGTLNRS